MRVNSPRGKSTVRSMSMNFRKGVLAPVAGVLAPYAGELSESSSSSDGGAGHVIVALTNVTGGLDSANFVVSWIDTI